MKFLAHIKQNGGCDYTIGCGHAVKVLDAADATEATRMLLGDAEDGYGNPRCHGPNGDAPLKSITLYEIASVTNVDLAAHWRACEAQEAAQKKADDDAKELAEFERLRAKLGR